MNQVVALYDTIIKFKNEEASMVFAPHLDDETKHSLKFDNLLDYYGTSDEAVKAISRLEKHYRRIMYNNRLKRKFDGS